MSRRVVGRAGLTVVLGVVLVGSLLGPVRSFAATPTTTYTHPPTDIIITEVQTASLMNSGEEFVELYNNTTSDIDLSDAAHSGKDAWKLQYFSSSKLGSLLGTLNWASPFRTVALTGVIPAHDYYVLAGGTYQPGNIVPDQTYTATLADDGGALQLVDSATVGTVTTVGIHDQLAWSTDKTLPANSLLYGAPGAGASLQRLPNDDSEYVSADGALTSFTADNRSSPENAWTPPAPVTPPDIGDDDTSVDTTGDTPPAAPTVPDNQGLPAPLVTELLPNPAAPQTDEANEYIELFNPGDDAFNLNGYTLETGQTTLHDFTFTSDVLLQPHSYMAFYSADTGLSLSNSGGQARLLAADAVVLSQSDAYGTAADGLAWAIDPADGIWHWTLTPTPGAENSIHAPIVLAKASVVKAKKSSTAKVKGASTTKKAKATKAKKAKKSVATTAASSVSSMQPTAPIHVGVLAAVATLAVGYGVYEYRHDLANRIYQLRTYRAARRSARK